MSKEKVAGLLEKAVAAFGPNGEHWGQGTEHICSTDYLCFNVAVYHAAFEGHDLTYCDEANRMLKDAGGFKDGRESMEWNDAPERTWPDVKAVYVKAIQLAREPRP